MTATTPSLGSSSLSLCFKPPGAPASRGVTVRIPLAAPLVRGFRSHSVVVVREPTVQELGALTAGVIDEAGLICNLAGLGREDFVQLALADARRVIAAAHWLMGDIAAGEGA